MSPRPGPQRPRVNVRISTQGITWIDTAAAKAGVNRSEMIRRMLQYAVTHMPSGS